MITKNRTKKSFLLFMIALICVHCSSIKTTEQSTSYLSKAKSAEETAMQAQRGYESANKLANQFTPKKPQGGSSDAPANIPPPSNISDLPKYGTALARTFGKVISVSTSVETGANQNSPIVFDLVFVKNADAYTTLSTILAQDWFNVNDAQIVALKKQTKLFEIQTITVLPEQRTYAYLVRVPPNVQAGLLFVRLIGNTSLYPTLFDPYKNLNLEFMGSRFVSSQNQ